MSTRALTQLASSWLSEMRRLSLLLALAISVPVVAQRHPHRHALVHFAEHVALGVGVELGISQIAGGGPNRRMAAGLSSAALVAGFKEGSDAISGRDTRREAAWHAFSQMIGAAIAAGARR